MVIKSMSRDDLILIKLAKAKKDLKAIEQQLVSSLKESLTFLVDIESLYELKNYLDDLIANWEDKEINLNDYDDGEDDQ